jgi:hypothetical protein
LILNTQSVNYQNSQRLSEDVFLALNLIFVLWIRQNQAIFVLRTRQNQVLSVLCIEQKLHLKRISQPQLSEGEGLLRFTCGGFAVGYGMSRATVIAAQAERTVVAPLRGGIMRCCICIMRCRLVVKSG